MFDFDDHSSDGDTISSATENNLIEEKVLPTISSTKNRKKWILKKKQKKKSLQIQNKKYIEYNKHVSDRNDNTKEDNHKNTNIQNKNQTWNMTI